jgi:signal transduction histidine kinase/ligand-binding sensor domain-containing protein
MVLASVSNAETETNTTPFLIKSWRTPDGLPQNSVQALAQTTEGYLWVGTRGGLARFDGVRFVIYGLADGLKGLNIVDLIDDGEGGLWIGTLGGGLSRWHGGRISTLTMAEGLAHNDVMALAPAPDGGVWIGSKGGLQLWRRGVFTRIGETEGLNGEVIALAVDGKGGLWATMEETGLFYCQEGRCEVVDGPADFRQFHGYSLLVDREGDLWVSIGNGTVLRRHGAEWTTFNETHGLPYSFVYCLAQGAGGEIWAGSHEAGLYVLRDGRFHAVPGMDNAVRAVRMCRDGVMWVGTQTGGLSRLIPQSLTEYAVAQGNQRGEINALVEESPGEFWITTYGGGLYRGGLKELARVQDVQILDGRPFLKSGLKMSDGTLFFGGARVLLRRLPKAREFQSLTFTETVNALCEDADGSLLFGTREGEMKRLPVGKLEPAIEAKFPAPISRLLRPPGNAVWVATQGAGLYRWEAGNVRRWTTADGLPTDVLRALYSDAKGTLWIGTAGGGLAWLEDGRFHSVNSRRGLGDDVVSQILEDAEGDLWLGCNRGIFRVIKAELHDVAAGAMEAVHPLVLDESDGMLVAECTGGHAPAGSGKLYFSTVRGVVEIDPTRFARSTAPPPVLIEEVMGDGKPIGPATGPLVIEPGLRGLEIHFTAFNSFKSEQIRFRYRLGGADEKWTEVYQKRFVNFSHLAAGDYLLEVSAANQDGHWRQPAASIPIKVRAFFWETSWFRVVLVLVVMGYGAALVIAAARRKIRRAVVGERLARAEAEARQRLNELGHLSRVALVGEMATSLAHELNQPLTAIVTNASAAQRFLARGNMNPDELREMLADIGADGHRAGEVIRGIKEMVRKDEGARHALDLNKVITDVLHLVHADALAHGCTLGEELDAALPPVFGDAVQFKQVLLNLVLNAFDAMRNPPCEPCRIEIQSRVVDAQMVEVSVRDFGPGLPPEALDRIFERFFSTKRDGMGMGLNIARSIIEAHAGTLGAENAEGGGARFWFRVPAHTAAPEGVPA